MTITRSFCPLDCGWHHDVDNTQLPAGVHVEITPEMSVDDIRDATTMAMAMRQVQDAEGIIRAHLESHELIEWVTALTTAQRRIHELEQARALILPQAMELHRLTGRIIDRAQRDRWQAAGRCGTCGFDGDRAGCQDCGSSDAEPSGPAH